MTRWSVAAGVFVVLFGGSLLLRALMVRFFAPRAARDGEDLWDWLLQFVRSTRWLFLAITALTIATANLHLTAFLHRLLADVELFVLLLQCAAWGSELIGVGMRRVAGRLIGANGHDNGLLQVLTFFLRLAYFGMLVLVGLQNLGVNVTALIAGLGLGGIAIGLALQRILGDLFSSFAILIDRPFVVGEFIAIDTFLGTVERIGLKTTRIRSLSGEELVFSNADLVQGRIHNYQHMTERRVVFTTRIAYETPLPLARLAVQIISAAVEEQANTRLERSHFKAIGTASLDYETVYWVLTPSYADYMEIQQQINLTILERFHENDIRLAYPTQTIYAHSAASLQQAES